ncbi:MAG TPA: copper-binding protein [Candidatus Binatia bacterium]
MDVRLLLAFVFLSIDLSFTAVSASGADAATSKSVHMSPPLEHHHPQNWRFTLPKGDATKGRAVFTKYECYYCHEVRGEDFVFAGVDYGPELSQMGPLHPLEYFAESIMNPDAVAAPEYRGADGKSSMPSYNEKMTVQELIDVSAYLASLKPPTTAKFVKGVGKIVAVVPQSKEVVIDHEPIKDFMDAMTMGYTVSSASVLKGLRAGDRIEFTLDTAQRVVTKIEKLKP